MKSNFKIVKDLRKGPRCYVCGVLKSEAESGCWRRKRHWFSKGEK
jgi:hypothetical protein